MLHSRRHVNYDHDDGDGDSYYATYCSNSCCNIVLVAVVGAFCDCDALRVLHDVAGLAHAWVQAYALQKRKCYAVYVRLQVDLVLQMPWQA